MAQSLEYRNIVIIGLNNTGKSTIASKILCRDYAHLNESAETIASINETQKTISGKSYKITVVDAVGFGTSVAMSQKRVIELMTYLREHKIHTINLIFFVIAADRLSNSDKSILESAITNFKTSYLSKISALIITYCEQYSEAKRRDILKLFKEDDYTKTIGEMMSKGIFTTGFASTDNCNKSLLNDIKSDVKTSMEIIYNLIAGASIAVETTDLFNNLALSSTRCKCTLV